MKKLFAILLSAALILGALLMFASCDADSGSSSSKSGDTKSGETTIIGSWTTNINVADMFGSDEVSGTARLTLGFKDDGKFTYEWNEDDVRSAFSDYYKVVIPDYFDMTVEEYLEENNYDSYEDFVEEKISEILGVSEGEYEYSDGTLKLEADVYTVTLSSSELVFEALTEGEGDYVSESLLPMTFKKG